jgi:hypothetical protein
LGEMPEEEEEEEEEVEVEEEEEEEEDEEEEEEEEDVAVAVAVATAAVPAYMVFNVVCRADHSSLPSPNSLTANKNVALPSTAERARITAFITGKVGPWSLS